MSFDLSLPNQLFALTGITTGLMSGVLGIGGAFVMVPALLAIFGAHFHFDPHTALELTLGTTMACMIANSISSTMSYHKDQLINWSYIQRYGVLITAGTAIGVVLTQFFSPILMKLCFAGFCFWSGFNMVHKQNHESSVKPSRGIVALFGTLCGFIGIGGASLFVSYFIHSEKMEFKQAIGTAAALQVPIATIGAVSYLLLGLSQAAPGTAGYIYLPALLMIAIPCVVFVRIGVAIANHIHTQHLKKAFGVFTILIGLNMAYHALIQIFH